jgi:hypothetical protein
MNMFYILVDIVRKYYLVQYVEASIKYIFKDLLDHKLGIQSYNLLTVH